MYFRNLCLWPTGSFCIHGWLFVLLSDICAFAVIFQESPQMVSRGECTRWASLTCRTMRWPSVSSNSSRRTFRGRTVSPTSMAWTWPVTRCAPWSRNGRWVMFSRVDFSQYIWEPWNFVWSRVSAHPLSCQWSGLELECNLDFWGVFSSHTFDTTKYTFVSTDYSHHDCWRICWKFQ